MIITEKFVMLNLPKTGSKFARTAVKKLYEPYFRKFYPQYWLPKKKAFELILPTVFIRNASLKRSRTEGEHGVYAQIPQEHRNKKIFTVIRNPYDRLLSFYYYADWRINFLMDEAELKKQYPSFPNLSFQEFLDLHFKYGNDQFIHGLKTDFKYGPQTAQFIAFYAKDPVKTFESIKGDFSIKDNLDQFGKVDFLHTEQLNKELHDYLLSLGYPESRIGFIKEKEKMNISDKKDKIELTPELKQFIYEKEKPLFDLFPEYR